MQPPVWGATTLSRANGYSVLEPFPFSSPPVDAGGAALVSQWSVPRQLPRAVTGFWTDTLKLRIYASSATDLRAKIQALQDEYQKPSNTLSAQLSDDTEIRTVILVQQAAMPIPVNVKREALHSVDLDIPLVAEPYAYGIQRSVTIPWPLSCPALLDCGVILGDLPTPLDITLASITAGQLHAVYVGLQAKNSLLGLTDYIREGEDGSWSGGTCTKVHEGTGRHGTDAAHDCEKNTGAEATGVFSDAALALEAGPFLVLAKIASWSGVATSYARFGALPNVYTDAQTGWHIAVLGSAWAPALSVRNAAASTYAVYMACGAGDAGVGLDFLFLLPAPFLGWHHPDKAGNCSILNFAGDGKIWADDIESYAGAIAGTIDAVGATKLPLFVESPAGGASCNVTATIKYYPRYASI
jgi:hypothetical protein